MKRIILSFLAIAFIFQFADPQVIKPVKWTLSTRDVDKDHTDLVFTAVIKSPWHMYGLNIPEGGPIPTTISFQDIKGFALAGKPTQSPEPEVVDDKIFNMKLELHSNKVTFTQRVKRLQTDSIIITGMLDYMTCSDMQCVLGDQDFTFRLKGKDTGAAAGVTLTGTSVTGQSPADVPNDSAATAVSTAAADTTAASRKSLLGVFLLSLLAGLGGLLTPCVYPMIPMTVSFFLRGNKTRARAISEALVFGLSIVFLYTFIGVLVAVFKNPNAVNNFTTHWLTNLIFFMVFMLLSASFFGMFEILSIRVPPTYPQSYFP